MLLWYANNNIWQFREAWHAIWSPNGPNWGQEVVFPTNPDLADILGRTDLNFENLSFLHFLDPKVLDFQVPRFPKLGLGRAGLGPGLNLGLGPSGGRGASAGPGGHSKRLETVRKGF